MNLTSKNLINCIISFLRRNILNVILFVFALIAFLIWIFGKNPGSLSDFGLNAFTEILGIIITVLIVENFIKKHNDRSLQPIKAAIYRDIQLYVCRIVGFWYDVHMESVPENDPDTVEELFSEKCFEKILISLSLDGEPKAYPNNWWEWFAFAGRDIKERGEKILDRYFAFLEPDVYKSVHSLNDSFFINGMSNILSMRSSDLAQGVPRPKVLKAYYGMPSNEDFDNVIALYKWCEENYLQLVKSKFNVYPDKLSITSNKKVYPLASVISPEQLINQCKAYEKWMMEIQKNRNSSK